MGFGVIVALAASLVYGFANDNITTVSSILPVDSSTALTTLSYTPQSFSPPGWSAVPGFAIYVIGLGQAEGDCALDPSTTISGVAPGSGAVQLSAVAFGATHVNVLACPNCLFGPTTSISAALRYSCQNVVLGVAAVNATGGAVLSSINVTARAGERLSAVMWTLSPLIEVRAWLREG
jgi:hypothetical protein